MEDAGRIGESSMSMRQAIEQMEEEISQLKRDNEALREKLNQSIMELSLMTEDRDSESRWASHYKMRAEKTKDKFKMNDVNKINQMNMDVMKIKKLYNTQEFRLAPPPKYKWYITITDDSHAKLYFYEAPNIFHRFMQRMILGIRWVKCD